MCTDHDLDLFVFVPVDHDLDLPVSVQIMIQTCMCVYRSRLGPVLSVCMLSNTFAVGDFYWGQLETRSLLQYVVYVQDSETFLPGALFLKFAFKSLCQTI